MMSHPKSKSVTQDAGVRVREMLTDTINVF